MSGAAVPGPQGTLPGGPQGTLAVRVIAMPADTNPAGDIFGGWLMSWMDLAGGSVAAGHCGGRVVTVAVDGMTFLKPVRIGNEVSIYGRIVEVGRTSLKVRLEAWRSTRLGMAPEQVTQATFTFVAIGADGQKTRVPALVEHA